MPEFAAAVAAAFELIVTLDSDLLAIILLSLKVNLTALTFSLVLGLPLGAIIGLYQFPGRRLVIVILNALMGLPPVVVGLIVYLLLSRSGPFGVLGLLFTPTAMIIAQVLLVTPIIAALSRQVIADLWAEYSEQLRSFGATSWQSMTTLLWDARFSLVTTMLAGFGRASAEVGAVMIVGGNIDHVTRVMTTAIALETSKGNLTLALGLGIVLLLITFAVNATAFAVREGAARRAALV